MFQRLTLPVATLLATAALVPGTVAAAHATTAPQHSETGVASVARFEPEHWAAITRLPKGGISPNGGYYYDAGQQNTHLVVTLVNGRLRFTDTHTNVLRAKPDGCDRKRADRGLVVTCRVPRGVGPRHPLTVKVFTRLGNDYVDTSALPAAFELYGLADRGRDVFKGGAGDDFINGAQNRDRVWGGTGHDWLRGNLGNDDIYGGPGRDRIVGVYGDDLVYGGPGNDEVGGGPGADHLYAGPGIDNRVICGTGADRAFAKRTDRLPLRDCESISWG